MIKHIKIMPLIFGIVLGIIGIMFIKPEQNVVYKYPSPDNAGKITYKDKNGICYKYSATSVECDKNESRLKDYPLNK
jgi:hypothetical protein